MEYTTADIDRISHSAAGMVVREKFVIGKIIGTQVWFIKQGWMDSMSIKYYDESEARKVWQETCEKYSHPYNLSGQ